MGIFDKFLENLKLNNDEDDMSNEYYDDDDDDVLDIPQKSVPQKVRELPQEESPKKNVAKITPLSKSPKRMSDNGMQVRVIKPTSVEDTWEITETLLEKRPVILNLEGLEVSIAQRIIDVTYGSCYAINGHFQPVSNYIFIITPSSVDISGDVLETANGTFDVPINK